MPEEEIQPIKVATKAPREAPLPAKEIPYPPEPTPKPNLLDRFWFIFVVAAIICLVALGTLLVLNRKITPSVTAVPTPIPSPVEEVDEATRLLEEQGTSDEITEIETDLNATDLTDLDKELSDIENEFIIE